MRPAFAGGQAVADIIARRLRRVVAASHRRTPLPRTGLATLLRCVWIEDADGPWPVMPWRTLRVAAFTATKPGSLLIRALSRRIRARAAPLRALTGHVLLLHRIAAALALAFLLV